MCKGPVTEGILEHEMKESESWSDWKNKPEERPGVKRG